MKTDRPRLLVCASTYPRWPGDTEPGFVHELARRLTRRFDVAVLAPHAPGSKTREIMDGVRVRRFRYAPAMLERLAYNGGIMANLRKHPWMWLLLPPFCICLLVAIFNEIRRGAYTFIHAHWIIPQGIAAVIARAVSRSPTHILCTAHGSDLFSLRGHIGNRLKRFALQRADAVSVVSHALANEAASIAPGAPPARVLPMGVDLRAQFTPDANITREEDLLLFVGRLTEPKGVTVLLNAFAQLHKTHPGLRLEIIGDGPERIRLEKQIAKSNLSDSIYLAGALTQAEIVERLRRATLFTMPSTHSEGFGLVQVEAMGCGCPVISSDLPAVHDIITDEVTGLLVPPGSSVGLAAAMHRLLSDPVLRDKLAGNALEHVRGNFDWEHIADQYATLLEGMHYREPSNTSSNNKR